MVPQPELHGGGRLQDGWWWMAWRAWGRYVHLGTMGWWSLWDGRELRRWLLHLRSTTLTTSTTLKLNNSMRRSMRPTWTPVARWRTWKPLLWHWLTTPPCRALQAAKVHDSRSQRARASQRRDAKDLLPGNLKVNKYKHEVKRPPSAYAVAKLAIGQPTAHRDLQDQVRLQRTQMHPHRTLPARRPRQHAAGLPHLCSSGWYGIQDGGASSVVVGHETLMRIMDHMTPRTLCGSLPLHGDRQDVWIWWWHLQTCWLERAPARLHRRQLRLHGVLCDWGCYTPAGW